MAISRLDSPTPLRGRDIILILGLSIGAIHLSPLVVQALVTALRLRQEDITLVGIILVIIGLQAAAMIASVYLVAVRWRGLSWSDLGMVAVSRTWFLRALRLAALTIVLTVIVNSLIAIVLGKTPSNPQLNVVAPAGFVWFGLIGMLIMAGLAAPIAEELVFRGVLYRWMRAHWGLPMALLISALCFSLLHGIGWLVPALALVGMILALVYERSGSLWPAIMTHGCFNAINTILIYTALARGWQL